MNAMFYKKMIWNLTILATIAFAFGSGLSAQNSEFDQPEFRTFTAKNLIFPLKEIVPRAKIENSEVTKAFRCTMKSGWSFEDLVALRYGQSKWLLCWRFDSGPACATVGSKFISELSEEQKVATEIWLALAENEGLWSGPAVVGDPTAFDDGRRVVVARLAHDKFGFRAFHKSAGIKFPKILDQWTDQSSKVLASLKNDQPKAEAGAGHPATHSESDSESRDKPQPDTEGRSR